ncbi:MAG: hydroxymethylglutaryl-CoA lyase [Acidimicrobiales bacterium]
MSEAARQARAAGDAAGDGVEAAAVEIVEVSPRDGLQNEAVLVSTEVKAELIARAAAAGLRRIEATSFAHPRRVPQMADAEAVLAALPARPGVTYTTLVLNEKGYERALAAGATEINMVITASDTFADRNQGATIDQLVAGWARIAARAHADGVRPTVALAVAFGCPYEGEVPAARVVEICSRLLEAEPAELGIADSIGCAAPSDVTERFAAVGELAMGTPLRAHFHNTRNTGLANAAAAVEAGVRRLDASLGGIGGCPFAPNATGNIPTEDLVWMLERMGYRTGVDLDQLIDSAVWLGEKLGKPVPGMMSRARPFPQVAAVS